MNKANKREKNSHKGDNGRLLIVAGSSQYPGALILSAKAVFRTGVDLVYIACPENVGWVTNCALPDVITIKLKGKYLKKEHEKDILKEMKKYKIDTILIGPGLGKNRSTLNLVKSITKKTILSKIIDADALKAINIKDVSNSILTPHQEEYKTLLKNSKLTEKTLKNNLKDNIILLKGAEDKIMSKTTTKTNKIGNSGMTVAGTGDILAGITAGLVAQKQPLQKAALTAAKINGSIGEKLYKKYYYGYIASQFLDYIPGEIKKLK